MTQTSKPPANPGRFTEIDGQEYGICGDNAAGTELADAALADRHSRAPGLEKDLVAARKRVGVVGDADKDHTIHHYKQYRDENDKVIKEEWVGATIEVRSEENRPSEKNFVPAGFKGTAVFKDLIKRVVPSIEVLEHELSHVYRHFKGIELPSDLKIEISGRGTGNPEETYAVNATNRWRQKKESPYRRYCYGFDCPPDPDKMNPFK